MLAVGQYVNNKEGKGLKARTQSRMLECVADETHEAHLAPILHNARVTPQEWWAALLEFANPAQRRLHYPCQPEPEPASFVEVDLPFFAMDDGARVSPRRQVPVTSRSRTAGQSSHIPGLGSTRVPHFPSGSDTIVV